MQLRRGANGSDAKFLLMDAETMHFRNIRVFWSIESISTIKTSQSFFASASRLLKPAAPSRSLTFIKREISRGEATRIIYRSIEMGISWNYKRWMTTNNIHIERPANHARDSRTKIAPKHGIVPDIIKDRKFWGLA